MQPRIYTYKITFEDVPYYYYYGVHKEKVFGEDYWGSPVTNKWCWELYTPKKQILELFDYTDEGYIKAQEIEKRLIKPVLNDKWCLNENVGGNFSLNVLRKIANKKVENKIGLFSLSSKELSIFGKKGGCIGGPKGVRTQIENNVGIFGLSEKERSENSKNGGKVAGKKLYEEEKGIFSLSLEQRLENCKKGGEIMGQRTKELGIGIHKLTNEQRVENGKKYGGIGGKVVAEKYSRSFSLISPTEERIDVINLTKFCKENNLTRANLQSVLRGNRNHHKGWKKA